MAVTTSKNSAGLCLARRFDAAPERVFAAWLDPGAARKWLFATPSEHPVEIDDRPGGLRLLIPNRWGGVEAVRLPRNRAAVPPGLRPHPPVFLA